MCQGLPQKIARVVATNTTTRIQLLPIFKRFIHLVSTQLPRGTAQPLLI